jgi:hypothetical protein
MSRVAIPAVGLLSKLCLNLNRVTVSGLPILLDALDESRRKGRGVLTSGFALIFYRTSSECLNPVSNHISTQVNSIHPGRPLSYNEPTTG